MWSAKGARGENRPPCIIPEGGKAFEDFIQSSTEKVGRVFGAYDTRPDFLDDSEHLEEEAGLFPPDARFPSCRADVRTRESAGDDINRPEIVQTNFPDVPESFRFGEPFFEDFRRIVVYLHLPFGLDSDPLEREVKCPDA